MNHLLSWFNMIIKKRRELRRWQRVVTVLAAVITFATTYALILPAITVEKDTAEKVGGMYLEREEAQDDLLEENASELSSVDIGANQENAGTYEYADDDTTAVIETDAEIPDYDSFQEEAVVDSSEAAPYVKTLEAKGKDYTVILPYDETSGVPEEAYLTASEISQDSKEYKAYLEETKKAMGLTEEEILPRFAARFFDIKIMVGDEEFTPETGVSVEITYAEPLAEETDAEVSAVHFADKAADAEVIEANTTEIKDDGAATVEFTAESFSVYGIIYTVDFHWNVGGRTEKWNLEGGSAIGLKELVRVLKIVECDKPAEAADAANEADAYAAKIDLFMHNIVQVTFSDESLVKVVPVTADTTLGELKKAMALTPQYSEKLTERAIAAMDE